MEQLVAVPLGEDSKKTVQIGSQLRFDLRKQLISFL